MWPPLTRLDVCRNHDGSGTASQAAAIVALSANTANPYNNCNARLSRLGLLEIGVWRLRGGGDFGT